MNRIFNWYILEMFDTLKLIYTQDEALELVSKYEEVYKEKIKELEEDNRLLKNEIAWLKDHTKYNGITEEYYIDWTMTATEAKLRLQQAESNLNYISKLEEENKKLSEENGQLKSDLAFKNTMLDNVKAEYDSSQDVIKKLKTELEKWEKDYKEWIIVHCRNG